jgi:hypothetical protein
MTKDAMKAALKEALTETLQEQRELLHEVFLEVLEDFALAKAIRAGRETNSLSEKLPKSQKTSEVWD